MGRVRRRLKKNLVYKIKPLDVNVVPVSHINKEDGYIRKYIVKFEELKWYSKEMSVPTLINMFMCNTCCAVHVRYKELKQQELTWE